MVNRLKEIARITGLMVHFGDPKFIWPYVPRTGSRCLTKTFNTMGINLERLDELPRVDLDDFFIWTFVRNPYTKVESALTYFQVTWKEFLEKNHKYIEEGLQEDPRRVGKHLIPNTFFTHIGDHRLAKFIGYYENLEDDWRMLLRLLEIPHKDLVPNEWNIKNVWFRVKSEDNEFIKEMYKDDFRLLGYDSNFFQ